METGKDNRINILYALGALLVIAGHSHSSDWSTFEGTVLESIIHFIYLFHMPLFYCVAGYLFIRSASFVKNGYGKWLKEKAFRLMTPYLVLSFVAAIPKYYLEHRTLNGVQDFLIKTLLSPRGGVWGHFWFLPVLLIVYALFGMWRLLLDRKKKIAYPVTLIIALALFFMPYGTQWLALSDVKDAILYFVLGMLFKEYMDSTKRLSLAISVKILWCFIGTAASMCLTDIATANKIVSLPVSLLMLSVCWFLAELLKESKLLNWVGRHNFTIYIYSWPFQAAIMMVCDKLNLAWPVTAACMFAVGIAAPVIIILVYERIKVFHGRFFKLLLGMR